MYMAMDSAIINNHSYYVLEVAVRTLLFNSKEDVNVWLMNKKLKT
jgi:hypothetical protein